MKPRRFLCTTAAILMVGFVSIAGAQPDQKAPDRGNAKQSDKPAEPQQKNPKERQAPAQKHQQQQAAPHQQQPPAMPNRQMRPPVQGQPAQPAPSMTHRQMQKMPNQPQAQQPMSQKSRYSTPARTPQRQPVTTTRDRFAAPTRQVTQAPAQHGPGMYRAEQQQVWPRYRAQTWSSQHRTWVQRGGYNGYRIEDSRFNRYFGRPHRFHLSHYRMRVVGAYPQFYANGYWFTVLDPVPEYWDDYWYDTDYVTVIYAQDGYYLMNEAYPDAQIAISVTIR